MVKISDAFRAAIKLSDTPAYRIAQQVGVDQNFLSKVIRGIIQIKPGDERVLRVGKVLGLDALECFEEMEKNDGSGIDDES